MPMKSRRAADSASQVRLAIRPPRSMMQEPKRTQASSMVRLTSSHCPPGRGPRHRRRSIASPPAICWREPPSSERVNVPASAGPGRTTIPPSGRGADAVGAGLKPVKARQRQPTGIALERGVQRGDTAGRRRWRGWCSYPSLCQEDQGLAGSRADPRTYVASLRLTGSCPPRHGLDVVSFCRRPTAIGLFPKRARHAAV